MHSQTDSVISCVFALASPDFAVRLLVLAAAAQGHLCMPWNAFWDGQTWQKNLHLKSMCPGLFVEVTFYFGFPLVSQRWFYREVVWCHFLHGFGNLGTYAKMAYGQLFPGACIQRHHLDKDALERIAFTAQITCKI